SAAKRLGLGRRMTSFLASVIARSSLGLIEPRCFPKGIESASAESRAAGGLLESHRVTKRPIVGHRARSRTRPSVLGYAPLAHSAAGLGFARRAHLPRSPDTFRPVDDAAV